MKIVTDCAADLTSNDVDQYGITVAPLFIQFPDSEVNSNDISPDEFYQRLKNVAPQIPSTSQPSAGIFTSLYQKIVEAGDDIISIHISSGLSGTIGSARAGAAQIKERSVHIVDSLTLSGGQRFQVIAAALGAKAGKPKEFILERLEKIRASSELVFTLDTLEYLQRGGRIGRVQALASALLHIKPLIHVDKKDGKYTTVGKVRTIPKALDSMINHIIDVFGKDTPLWVSIMHGQYGEQAHKLGEIARERLSVEKVEILRISPALGVHTGPGVVGLAVVPIHLMEGLD